MFLVKAGTVIQVQAPKSTTHWNTVGWVPYTTKEDKLYDTHEVWDAVAVHNDREDVPMWARCNITDFGNVVIQRDGKFAMVKPAQIEYLD
jgi:hypothetical protein